MTDCELDILKLLSDGSNVAREELDNYVRYRLEIHSLGDFEYSMENLSSQFSIESRFYDGEGYKFNITDKGKLKLQDEEEQRTYTANLRRMTFEKAENELALIKSQLEFIKSQTETNKLQEKANASAIKTNDANVVFNGVLQTIYRWTMVFTIVAAMSSVVNIGVTVYNNSKDKRIDDLTKVIDSLSAENRCLKIQQPLPQRDTVHLKRQTDTSHFQQPI
jgi:hypothetical protein